MLAVIDDRTGADTDNGSVTVEQVVLLDEHGRRVGVHDKSTVHHRHTPLHLAFSCYLFDDDDRVLVSQRALAKATFPGVWTNSACGHPAPDENLADAVHRRVGDELGVRLLDVRLVLPRFRYRAVMANGVAENEMCPVFRAYVRDEPRPDPAEVEALTWVPWRLFCDEVLAGRREVSPWCRDQVTELAALGAPAEWQGDPADLPPAAREA